MFTPEQIANAIGAPLANVQAQWPLVVKALQWAGIDSHLVRVAAIATIARETGSFQPIPEEGDEAYFRGELGNDWHYHGRGLLQLSWSSNYRHYGDEIGVDLVANPDLALRDDISAKVLALYFKERGTAAFANAGNWAAVQTSVNGGYIGYDRFLAAKDAMLRIPEPPDAPSAPPTTALGVDAHLQQSPKADEHVVADLKAGCHLTFDGPDGKPLGITPHWARVKVLSGTTQKLKPAAGLVGYLKRADLRTVGG